MAIQLRTNKGLIYDMVFKNKTKTLKATYELELYDKHICNNFYGQARMPYYKQL